VKIQWHLDGIRGQCGSSIESISLTPCHTAASWTTEASQTPMALLPEPIEPMLPSDRNSPSKHSLHGNFSVMD